MRRVAVVVAVLAFGLAASGCYSGGYRLYVTAIQVPEKKQSGSPWDADGSMARFLASNDAGVVLGALVQLASYAGPSAIAQLLVAAQGIQATSQVRDALLFLADLQGRTAAPDPVLVMNFHGYGTYRTPLVKDSHLAGWTVPAVQVPGSSWRRVSLTLWDCDIAFDDLIGRARFRMGDLEREGGGPVAVRLPGGAVVHLEVERLVDDYDRPILPTPRMVMDSTTGKRVWSRISFRQIDHGGYVTKAIGLPNAVRPGDLFDSARHGRCEVVSLREGNMQLRMASGAVVHYPFLWLGRAPEPSELLPAGADANDGSSSPTSRPGDR